MTYIYYFFNPHHITIVNCNSSLQLFLKMLPLQIMTYPVVRHDSTNYLYNLWWMTCYHYIVWHITCTMHNNYFYSFRCYFHIEHLYNVLHVTCIIYCRVCCLWNRKSFLPMDTCTQGISWLTMECASKTIHS